MGKISKVIILSLFIYVNSVCFLSGYDPKGPHRYLSLRPTAFLQRKYSLVRNAINTHIMDKYPHINILTPDQTIKEALWLSELLLDLEYPTYEKPKAAIMRNIHEVRESINILSELMTKKPPFPELIIAGILQDLVNLLDGTDKMIILRIYLQNLKFDKLLIEKVLFLLENKDNDNPQDVFGGLTTLSEQEKNSLIIALKILRFANKAVTFAPVYLQTLYNEFKQEKKEDEFGRYLREKLSNCDLFVKKVVARLLINWEDRYLRIPDGPIIFLELQNSGILRYLGRSIRYWTESRVLNSTELLREFCNRYQITPTELRKRFPNTFQQVRRRFTPDTLRQLIPEPYKTPMPTSFTDININPFQLTDRHSRHWEILNKKEKEAVIKIFIRILERNLKTTPLYKKRAIIIFLNYIGYYGKIRRGNDLIELLAHNGVPQNLLSLSRQRISEIKLKNLRTLRRNRDAIIRALQSNGFEHIADMIIKIIIPSPGEETQLSPSPLQNRTRHSTI